MNVLFITSEVAGIFKIGGLADVSFALPVALEEIGVRVTVVLPFYESIDSGHVRGIGKLSVDYGDTRETVFIFEKKIPGVPFRLLLLRHPKLNRYQGDPIEDTFAFYSKAVASLYNAAERLFGDRMDIVHCHDWHTALVPLLIGENNKLRGASQSVQSKSSATIVTIHNLMYQGVASVRVTDRLHAPRDIFHIRKGENGESISFLREGFEYADHLTTVSPTYAREIVAGSHHDGIGDSLVRRRDDLSGFLNGIDRDAWNPETDTMIHTPYTVDTVGDVKPELKTDVRKEFKLPTESSMLLGFVGRIEPRQKGIDLVMDAMKTCINDINIQLVILGTGDEKTVRELKDFAGDHSGKISFMNVFDDKIAHKIYAGCDMLLVPSKFEPCGLTQMIAMRYGTLPIVRKTGGLADSVRDNETGFVFEDYSADSLKKCLIRAYRCRGEQNDHWKRMIRNAMGEDFSWNASARHYKNLYNRLLR